MSKNGRQQRGTMSGGHLGNHFGHMGIVLDPNVIRRAADAATRLDRKAFEHELKIGGVRDPSGVANCLEKHHKEEGLCYIITATAADPAIYNTEGYWGIRDGEAVWIPDYAIVAKAGELLIRDAAPELALMWRAFYDSFGALAAEELNKHPENKAYARESVMPYITLIDTLLTQLGVKEVYMSEVLHKYAPLDEGERSMLESCVVDMGFGPEKVMPIAEIATTNPSQTQVSYQDLCSAIADLYR